MIIAITGATGFVGTHLCDALTQAGHQIIMLRRSDVQQDATQLATQLQGCQAVINLAGENISRRWTAKYMTAIYNSRVLTTQALISAMRQMDEKPTCFISTSALGAFDSKGDYGESDPPNATDFLGRLSHDWEASAREAESLGIRTLIFRLGLVLGRGGGMMKQLLPPFRLGLGGPIVDGRQPFSWIHIDDLIRAYLLALGQEEMSGVYHLCAPESMTNRQFTKTLGKVLHRPTLLPVPKLLLQLLFGQGAEVITSGQTLHSERLSSAGFNFKYETVEQALIEITGSRPT
jgi:uncharacterized protein (TIGR01777 family)